MGIRRKGVSGRGVSIGTGQVLGKCVCMQNTVGPSASHLEITKISHCPGCQVTGKFRTDTIQVPKFHFPVRLFGGLAYPDQCSSFLQWRALH